MGLATSNSVIVSVTCLAVLLYIFMMPSPIDPDPYIYENSPPPLEGPLAKNRLLQRTNKLFEGILVGPESFASNDKGELFTGTSDGRIWKIVNEQAKEFSRTGVNHTSCGTFEMEPQCGRPKGMKVHKDGFLYVADAYKGLLRIDQHSGDVETILTGVEGVPFKFLNGLDISSDGIVYFTDSSTKWDRRNHKYEVMETNNLGRLISYNPETKEARKLLDGLYLANGVSLSPDEDFLVVSEMSVCKLRKYYLNGPMKGKSETFHSNLPGYPDNIKVNKKGTFYVGIASARFEGISPIGSFLDVIGPYPAVKRFIAKVLPLEAYSIFLPKHALFVEIDLDGNVINSYHDPEGTTVRTGLSEVYEFNNSLYIGHFSAPFLGKLDL